MDTREHSTWCAIIADVRLGIECPGNAEAEQIMHDALDKAEALLADAENARYTARFVPQAWVRDNAIEVDTQGPTEWDCTDEFLALGDTYRAMLLDEMEVDGEALDGYDCLKADPAAPEWIREWQGPFSLYVRKADA